MRDATADGHKVTVLFKGSLDPLKKTSILRARFISRPSVSPLFLCSF